MREFHCLLQSVSASQPLVVLLDSLDNIRSYNISREFAWIPRKLPAHVKIVLSCFTDEMAFSCLKVVTSSAGSFEICVSEILTFFLKIAFCHFSDQVNLRSQVGRMGLNYLVTVPPTLACK